MNKSRRAQIDRVMKQADAIEKKEQFSNKVRDDLVNQITKIKEDEQEYLDNLSEAAAEGEKGDMAQEAIDLLEDAIGELNRVNAESSEGDILDAIEEVCNNLIAAQGE